MLAGVFKREGVLSLEERKLPQITKPDEVLIRVLAAGICGTDIHILATPPGHPATPGKIMGHEYVGEVVEVGEGVRTLQIGDRVVVDPTITCGICRYCQMGSPNLCEEMTTLGIFLDGGWTSYSVAPARALHKISKHVSPEIAVFGEPLSCVINGCEKIKVQPGESVAVLGAGPMGQLFIQVLRAAGAGKIIAVDLSEYRLEYAKRSGATMLVNPKRENVEETIRRETEIGCDVVVDCVGSLFDQALTLVRRGGQILLLGMNQHATPPIRQHDITRYEVSVKGTYISRFSFPKVIQILEAGVLRLDQLISHRVGLHEIDIGLEAMRKGEAIKVIVTPHES
jgi:threonine dehydrogenase-like Zn-dependent dehydrogenase